MVVHYNLAAALIANLCGTLILINVLINSHLVRESKEHKANKWMIAMIVVCLIGSMSEIVYELINGHMFPFAREINLLGKTLNHAESYYAGFLFIGFMRCSIDEEEKHWPKSLKIATIIVCSISAVILIANLFTGIAFSVDENNVYSRGPLGQLGLIVSLLTLIYTVVMLTKDNKNSRTYIRFPVLMYTLPFLVGGGLQMAIPAIRTSNVAFALGIVTIHLSVQKRQLYLDAMTGVYNRAYLDYFFSEVAKSSKDKVLGGILVDINSFKEINDTYGHAIGDEAIRNAAKVLKETSGSDYLIMRYGGDEFILIKENENIEGIKAQKEMINKVAAQFNEGGTNLYELSFAIGITEYKMTDNGFDGFLETMDKSLSDDKREYYARTGKERRR